MVFEGVDRVRKPAWAGEAPEASSHGSLCLPGPEVAQGGVMTRTRAVACGGGLQPLNLPCLLQRQQTESRGEGEAAVRVGLLGKAVETAQRTC